MRLYCKLAGLVLVTCLVQAGIGSGWVREASFAMRCLAAHASNDCSLEERLICETERQFEEQRERESRQVAAMQLASAH